MPSRRTEICTPRPRFLLLSFTRSRCSRSRFRPRSRACPPSALRTPPSTLSLSPLAVPPGFYPTIPALVPRHIIIRRTVVCRASSLRAPLVPATLLSATEDSRAWRRVTTSSDAHRTRVQPHALVRTAARQTMAAISLRPFLPQCPTNLRRSRPPPGHCPFPLTLTSNLCSLLSRCVRLRAAREPPRPSFPQQPPFPAHCNFFAFPNLCSRVLCAHAPTIRRPPRPSFPQQTPSSLTATSSRSPISVAYYCALCAPTRRPCAAPAPLVSPARTGRSPGRCQSPSQWHHNDIAIAFPNLFPHDRAPAPLAPAAVFA
ncbi:hypothetical protein B0H11DRAFT_2259899 [Mycena galericulata]|nr:hypothetical protein B0H11DRAFT_2259899 [Mycena galericulata]